MNDRKKWLKCCGLDQVVATENLDFINASKLEASESEPTIVWLGHSCFCIYWKGVRLVIDPVFDRWIGPFSRRLPVPDRDWLIETDLVLLSHGHMDHLSNGSLHLVAGRKLILPLKTETFLSQSNRKRYEIIGMKLGESHKVGGLEVKVVYAEHGGWRYPWQSNYFACGFVISDGARTVYYAGDSAYGNHFSDIGDEFDIDEAILPIGAYDPRWFLKSRHMNPEEAVQAALDLKARSVVPCHFGTYRLSLESMDDPMNRFLREASRAGVEWNLLVGI